MAVCSILFRSSMVRAILEGKKTQTRRVLDAPCKSAPAFNLYGTVAAYNENGRLYRWPNTHSVGNFLYVREAWHAPRSLDDLPPSEIPRDATIEYAASAHSYAEIGLKGKLRPSIFMPRWASRLTLIVTDVRVQQLQEITYADVEAEGVIPPSGEAFSNLWDSLNAKRGYGWDVNPWVAAYTFTVHQLNVDQITGGWHG